MTEKDTNYDRPTVTYDNTVDVKPVKVHFRFDTFRFEPRMAKDLGMSLLEAGKEAELDNLED